MKRWAWFSLFGLVCACTGTETGNPSFQGSLGYDAYSSAPSVVALPSALSAAATGVTEVEAAWLVLGAVGFVEQQHCAADSASESAKGLGAGDHAGSQAPPTPVALVSGLYCGVNLPMAPGAAAPPNGPAALANHSMLIQGTLRDGRPFSLRSALQTQLFLHSSDGFELDAQRSGVVIGFDVATWLDTLDWDHAQVNDTGTVLVDETHNSDLLSSFERQVPVGITLFRDADHDGMLDPMPVALAHGE